MDFHNHFNSTTRAEAERWLSTAVKLLTTRDLHGTKTFAIRARESDPRLGATDQIIAVADTLLASESRTANNQPDWYAILQLARRTTHSLDLVATQYRRLALLLNPQANQFPYADQAFRLVSEAWAVLSNPSTKAFYDHQLNIYSRFESPPPPPQASGSNQLFERQFMQMHAPPPQPQPFLDFQQRLAPPLERPQPQPLHYPSQPLPQRPQPQQPLPQRPQPQHPLPQKPQPQHPIPQKPQPQLPSLQKQHNQPPQQPLHLPQKQQDQPQKQMPQPQQPISYGPPPPPPPQSPPPQKQQDQPQQQRPPVRKSPRKKDGRVAAEEETPNLNNVTESTTQQPLPESTPPSEPIPMTTGPTEPQADSDLGNFWTACPYCYHLFEYSRVYEECMLRCQNCKRAFHAVVIASPPLMDNGEANFCCWAYFPMGVSKNNVKETVGSSSWSPFSMMFSCPLPGGNNNKKVGRARNTAAVPRVYIDDDDGADDDVIDISDPSEGSDDEWGQKNKSRKTRLGRPKGKASTSKTPVRASNRLRKGMVSNGGTPGGVSASNGESSKRASVGTRKRGAAAMGRLDLNVEFSNNEVEEPAAQTMSNGNGTANGEGDDDDTIENIGFFEGLDEFFSSLPILNVADDKVKAN